MRLTVLAALLLAGCVSGNADSDGDGLTNDEERDLGTDPDLPDTDLDGIADGAEVQLGTDPLAADSDLDGLNDGNEVTLGTDPNDDDSDDDGLSDGAEVDLGSDPLDDDSDDDGFPDGDEVDAGSDPTDPMSYERSSSGEWPDLREWADTSSTQGYGIGDRFPDQSLTDQYGNAVDLYQFWGNVVLVDFSAGWCGPCRAVAVSAESEYRERADDGFVIVHLMIDDNANGGGITDSTFLSSWADQYAITFPVTDFSRGWSTAGSGLLSTGLYKNGIPFMVLLDQEMKIVQAETGSGSEGRLLSRADQLLGR